MLARAAGRSAYFTCDADVGVDAPRATIALSILDYVAHLWMRSGEREDEILTAFERLAFFDADDPEPQKRCKQTRMTRNFASSPRILILIVTASGLLACGEEPAPASLAPAEVSDSSGIRIVSIQASAPADTLRPRLLWEYGSEPPDYLFQRVGFGVVREDGSVVVADGGSNEVIAIREDGTGHRVLARTGQGPSEVRSPRQVVTHDGVDVWVEDAWGGKLLRVAGDSVADVLAGSAYPAIVSQLMPIGVDSTGRLLLTTGGYRPNFEEPWLHAALALFEPGTSRVDTVGTFQFAPRVGEPPISPFTGYGVVTVADGSFVTARTDIPQLVWRSADGAVAQISRWSADLDYADREDWEEFEASIRAGSERMNPGRSDAQYDAAHERVIAGWHLDASEPVRFFDEVIGAESGGVWLAPFTPARTSPPRTREWIVFAPDGDRLGMARFERPTRILHISEDRIVGVHTGALGVETVVAYDNPFGG